MPRLARAWQTPPFLHSDLQTDTRYPSWEVISTDLTQKHGVRSVGAEEAFDMVELGQVRSRSQNHAQDQACAAAEKQRRGSEECCLPAQAVAARLVCFDNDTIIL